jgi:hypothetical protein
MPNPNMTRTPHISALEKLASATYSQLFSLWMLLNLLCTVWYFILASEHSPSAPSHLAEMDLTHRIFNSFYFSVITATSLGYGDIIPLGFSKVLAMVQSIVALLIFALFVTKLVSGRQDATLEEVHRMTSESIFYNIRQGLFLVRKDFDTLIHILDTQKQLSEQDWEILTTAYLQAQNLIEEIPNLYNGQGHDLYTIDAKREKLLLEAIKRTIKRIDTFLDRLNMHSIDWHKNADSVAEYKELITIIHDVMPVWRKRSRTDPAAMFEEIMAMSEKLKERI